MAPNPADQEAPIHGDILEQIISHVPLLNLVPASHVSKPWRRAVAASLLHHSRRRLPWLILHLNIRRKLTTIAYDPHSTSWITLPPPAITTFQSSHPGLLHNLSLSHLAVSTDAFGATWRQFESPELWREDAVVALVGSRLIVAGGTCGNLIRFEGDPLAVEACNIETGKWEACQPMPWEFRLSPGATWLSVAAGDNHLHVLEKREGLMCSFNVETMEWGMVHKLNLDFSTIFLTAVGVAGERVIIAAAEGVDTEVVSITLWEVVNMEVKKIGAMPKEMVEEMVGDGWGLSSAIGFSVVGDFAYLYNPSDLGEVFVCEFGENGCRWASAGTPAVDRSARVVFGCATVGLKELKGLFGAMGGLE